MKFVYSQPQKQKIALARRELILGYLNTKLTKPEFVSFYNHQQIEIKTFEILGPITLPTYLDWIKRYCDNGIDGLLPEEEKQ